MTLAEGMRFPFEHRPDSSQFNESGRVLRITFVQNDPHADPLGHFLCSSLIAPSRPASALLQDLS